MSIFPRDPGRDFTTTGITIDGKGAERDADHQVHGSEAHKAEISVWGECRIGGDKFFELGTPLEEFVYAECCQMTLLA